MALGAWLCGGRVSRLYGRARVEVVFTQNYVVVFAGKFNIGNAWANFIVSGEGGGTFKV